MKITNPEKRTNVPAFIIKLYSILEEKQFEQIIQWGEAGDTFIVLNQEMMEQIVLQKYFKHNHFSSFLRQLNMYDFQKIRNQNNQQVFWHQHFQKDKKHLLMQLKRSQQKTQQKEKNLGQMNKFQQFIIGELKEIKETQLNDEMHFSHIINQHEQLLQQHKQIQLSLSTQRNIMEKKYDKLSHLVSMVVNQQDEDISNYFQGTPQQYQSEEYF